jgi:hypothetical protein
MEALEPRVLLSGNPGYANIAGLWNATESLDYTLSAMGESQSNSASGSAVVVIHQSGADVWYDRKVPGSNVVARRTGTVTGNHVVFTGPFVIVGGGARLTANSCTITGDVSADVMSLDGSGYAEGTVRGISFSIDGSSTAEMQRETFDLYSVAWGGANQIQMYEMSTGSWKTDFYASTGQVPIATGKTPVWVDTNGNGAQDAGELSQPVAYVNKGKPALQVEIHGDASCKGRGVWIRATDGADGVVFNGTAKVDATGDAKISLSSTNSSAITTAALIQNRMVELDWEISTDGGQNFSALTSTTHQLFVTRAKPTNPKSGTARRIDFATQTAAGATSELDAASKLGNLIQQESWFGNDNNNPSLSGRAAYEFDNAWTFLDNLSLGTRGQCFELSWLQTNSLRVIGIGAEVRYVLPRHASWKGLMVKRDTAAKPSVSTYYERDSSGDTLGFISGDLARPETMLFNWFEGCCYASHYYFMGGCNGVKMPTAADVLADLAAGRQSWHANWRAFDPLSPVSFPIGTRPTV